MLVFIDNFQYLSFSLVSLVKNSGENDFKHSNQEFDSQVIDLVKQWKIAWQNERFNERLPGKNKCLLLFADAFK